MAEMMKAAIIGGGWAGCAAAVELASSGTCHVTLFESRKIPGGRARRLEAEGKTLDSGQHILLGAYTESLRLMKKVGVSPDEAFLRLPLQMCYPPAAGGMTFITRALPAPLHLLAGLFTAKGLDMADKLALARFTSAAQWMGWKLNRDCSVSTLLARFSQTARLYRLLWRPLCIAALNTVPEEASAQIFLNVLRDSMGVRRSASDMLLPRYDLSALFPDKALDFLRHLSAEVFLDRTIRSLQQSGSGWLLDGEFFDRIILATSAQAASTLLNRKMDTAVFEALKFEPIHTCYFGYSPETRLSRAFFTLKDNPETGQWGQFVFDRGWLDPACAGVLAVVISTSSATSGLNRHELETGVASQLAKELGMPDLALPLWTRTVSDRQATFVCKPALARPDTESGLKGLFLAGDYVRSEYPGTLESAVQSGVKAAAALIGSLKNK